MNIPQPQFLVHQTLNSEFVEFVWKFPHKLDSPLKDQFICRIHSNPVIYFECGRIDMEGNYTHPPIEFKLGYGHLSSGDIITSPLNWPGRKFPEVYKNFTNGQDLIPLIADVKNYLKSV